MARIELQEPIYRRLAAGAEAEGLTLEAYLEQLSKRLVLENANLPPLIVEELDRFLDEEAMSHSTYQGTYSRADIYLDHA
jgi:hypothetical protein